MDFLRHIIPIIRRTGRSYPVLERELGRLTPEAQKELLLLLRDRDDAVHSAERKSRLGLGIRF